MKKKKKRGLKATRLYLEVTVLPSYKEHRKMESPSLMMSKELLNLRGKDDQDGTDINGDLRNMVQLSMQDIMMLKMMNMNSSSKKSKYSNGRMRKVLLILTRLSTGEELVASPP